MKTGTSISHALRVLLIGASSLFFFAAGGCAGATDSDVDDFSEGSDGEEGEVEGTSSALVHTQSCSFGYYLCVRTGEQFDYEPPGCGPDPSKPRAAQICAAYCKAPCRDSGWLSY